MPQGRQVDDPSLKDYSQLAGSIRNIGRQLGFQDIGITNIHLSQAEERLIDWLNKGFHGTMDYMERHGSIRTRPEELLPGTIRVISARMEYLPEALTDCFSCLNDPERAYVSRYALGRDYHKLIRKRLQKLAEAIAVMAGSHGFRVFADSAPVLEKPLAEKAGLGWIGKHTNLINRKAGSFFFLGEIYTDLPLPVDEQTSGHCGSCTACIQVCPTEAIVAPYQLDARRCISYLTIEWRGSIPVEFRKPIGNRIYGCDDCQLVCPWNRYASLTREPDFLPRNGLDRANLLDLFAWSKEKFQQETEGSAIRRIGYECWLRNLAVAIGNGPPSEQAVDTLIKRLDDPSMLVREHVIWALEQ